MPHAARLCFIILTMTLTGWAVAQTSPERDHALIAAAERGEIVVVRQLVAQGARINARDHRGRTALLLATQRNHVEVARFLIREGADVNARDLIQDTPFLYAGAQGRTEILRLTLETVKVLLATGINVDHVNNLGWTALMEAVILGDGGPAHTEIVRLLVAAKANASIPDRDGVTPLEHARRRGYDAMVQILQSAGAR
jgi:ankyrin repeat protein